MFSCVCDLVSIVCMHKLKWNREIIGWHLYVQDQRIYDDISQTVDASLQNIDRIFSSEHSSTITLQRSTCFGGTPRRHLSHCFANERSEKKHTFWLNLLLAEEWNYFYLLKDKSQPYAEQEKHIKRIHSTTKLSSILLIYFNSFIPQKFSSSLHRTICLNHYERLHCLFHSLLEVMISENESHLCSNILQRIVYLIRQLKEQENENIFIQFPSFVPRTLILSTTNLNIMSKDKQISIERIQLHFILGMNIQPDKHSLVLSVEQPPGSNSIHNYQFAHADRTIINQWYQLLDKYVKQAKCDHMNQYQEYRI